MDRYHLVKIAIVAFAIAVAVAGTSMGTQQGQHRAVTAESPYSAAVQLQETGWRVATCLGRTIRHIILRA
ncbi:MAG TPA: hypothetical protein VGM17_01810 [Rhizomicrobium sp.]|jgi:hypothetical protein